MADLKGKAALVTGSTSGIGQATAIALAARGAHILVVGRNEPSPEYQQLIDLRGVAMDARFSLLDGLPTTTEIEGASE